MEEQKIESVEAKTVEPKTVEGKTIQLNLDPSAMITAGLTTAVANVCAIAGVKVISATCKGVAIGAKKIGHVVGAKAKEVKEKHRAKKAEKKALAETEKAKQDAAEAIVAALEAEKAEN